MKILFRLRTTLAILPLLVLFFMPPSPRNTAFPSLFFATLVFAAGLIIRIWAQRHLGYRVPKRFRKVMQKPLVRTGPYRACRNPIYVGNILIIISFGILLGRQELLPLIFIWSFGVYHFTAIRYEETHLKNRYGVLYDTYLSEVPRWLPNISSLRSAMSEKGPFPLSLAVKYELHNLVWALPFLMKRFGI